MIEHNRILLVNSDEGITRYFREELVIKRNYSVSTEYTLSNGIASFKDNIFDIVFINLGSVDLDTLTFLRELKKIDPDCVIIIIDTNNPSVPVDEISRIGVYDFIKKPIDLEKLLFLVRKGIELHVLMTVQRKLNASLKEYNISLQRQNIVLAKRIEESTKNLVRLYEDLRTTYMRTIKVLAQAIDARDHYTHSHSENVTRYAVAISEEMNLSAKDIEMIRDACELHDLGKIGVQDNILSKPTQLTPEEWKEIKRHPITAAQILEPLTFLNNVIDLIRQHHEHYDGSGYPQGIKGEDIPLGARIIHLADAYDAMRSARSYRKVPLPKLEAILEIKKNNGTQFDPKVVAVFLKIVDKIDY